MLTYRDKLKKLRRGDLLVDCYDMIVRAYYSGERIFPFSWFAGFRLNSARLSLVLNSVMADHPEFCLMSHPMRATSLNLEQFRIRSQDKVKILSTIKMLLSKTKGHSDYFKIEVVHDWFLNNVSYSDDQLSKSTRDIDIDMFTIKGPFLRHRAVCQGICQAAKLIFDCMGIASRLIMLNRRSGPGHSILSCEINDHGIRKRMNLDITADLLFPKLHLHFGIGPSEKEILYDGASQETFFQTNLSASEDTNWLFRHNRSANSLFELRKIIENMHDVKGKVIEFRYTGDRPMEEVRNTCVSALFKKE